MTLDDNANHQHSNDNALHIQRNINTLRRAGLFSGPASKRFGSFVSSARPRPALLLLHLLLRFLKECGSTAAHTQQPLQPPACAAREALIQLGEVLSIDPPPRIVRSRPPLAMESAGVSSGNDEPDAMRRVTRRGVGSVLS